MRVDIVMNRGMFSLLFLVLLIYGSSPARLSADGGEVRMVTEHGDLRASIFTAPTPLRAGPIDVSIFLQNAVTQQPLTNANIVVRLTEKEDPEFVIQAHATTEAATNKLLQAALFDLPRPGWWIVEVECLVDQRSSVFAFNMEAGPPLPRWLSVWPIFTWPFGIILLFAVHRHLVARKRQAVTRTRPPFIDAPTQAQAD